MGRAGREAIGGMRRWAGRARGDWRDAAQRGECAAEWGQCGCWVRLGATWAAGRGLEGASDCYVGPSWPRLLRGQSQVASGSEHGVGRCHYRACLAYVEFTCAYLANS